MWKILMQILHILSVNHQILHNASQKGTLLYKKTIELGKYTHYLISRINDNCFVVMFFFRPSTIAQFIDLVSKCDLFIVFFFILRSQCSLSSVLPSCLSISLSLFSLVLCLSMTQGHCPTESARPGSGQCLLLVRANVLLEP